MSGVIAVLRQGLLLLGAVAALGLLPDRAGTESRKVYFFGNSLIHHLSDSDETTVPHWLALMARAGGHRFAADGQWGLLRDFARADPPVPGWDIAAMTHAWIPGRGSFDAAGFDGIIVSPANFIQYQSWDRPYDGDNPEGATPLSAMLDIIDRHGDGRVVWLYEGWADMASVTDDFPPSRRGLRKYHGYNRGTYHRWYEDFVARLKKERPDADIRLIPVAKVLSDLMTGEDLGGLGPGAFYLDNAPHGTPATYLLAAMVVYAALYGEAAPAGWDLPPTIPPEIARNFAALAEAALKGVMPESQRAEVGMAKEPPPPGAPKGLDNPGLAMGLNGISDWSTQHPFLNLMKSARPWVGHENGQWGAWDEARLRLGGFLDENGWLMRMPPGVERIETFILSDQQAGNTSLAGRYVVRWKGEGTLRISGNVVRSSHGRNSAWFTYEPGEGEISLAITRTDPQGNGNYLRDIEIIREDMVEAHEAGALFNPDWLARVADLRLVRFMDWMMTNGSPVTTWAERPHMGDYTYARRGVPIEVMVDLANTIGADPWFNMPHLSDDDYATRFATYLLGALDPRLVAHVEFSNELWNFTFPQAQWAGEQARLRWGSKAGEDAWMQFAGARASEVMRLWADVFAGQEARLKRVVAVHTGWPGLEEPLLNAPLYLAESAGHFPPVQAFDAYAVSGYFGFELGDGEEGKLTQLRDWLAAGPPEAAISNAARTIREGSLREVTGPIWAYHARVAAEAGLDLMMYEGGTHVVAHGHAVEDVALTGFFNRFNYSPEMAALYGEELAAWRRISDQPFNAFVDVAAPSKHGSWGALRHLDDSNPRWDVLMADNDAGGTPGRAGDPFRHGVFLQATEAGERLDGTWEEDVLIARGGDDVLVSHGGSDVLHGGGGLDTAELPGTRSDWRFTFRGPQIIARAGSTMVRMTSIEKLGFSDEPGRVYRLELPSE